MSKRELQEGKLDIRVDLLYKVLLGFLAVGIIVHVVIAIYFGALFGKTQGQTKISPLAATLKHIPPEPRLQVTPVRDLKEINDKEIQILGSYGWVDQSKGVVRIPIQEAMRIIVEKQILNTTVTTQTQGKQP